MAGLLDQYNPQIDGLGLGLLGASQALLTPRRQGGGVGAAFGAFGGGLMQGEQMQRQRSQDAQRNKLYDAQIKNYESDAEYRKGLIDAKQTETQRAAAAAAQKQQFIEEFIANASQRDPEIAALARVDLTAAIQRAYPKPEWRTWFDEKGRQTQGYVAPGKAPQSVGGSERKVQGFNTGGAYVFGDPLDMDGRSLPMTMTPGDAQQARDAAAGRGVTMRGQDMSDRRQRELAAATREAGEAGRWQYDSARGVRINTQTGESQPIMQGGQPIGQKDDDAIKRTRNSKDALEIITKAEAELDRATSGYIGAGVDLAARTLGVAPAGAIATGNLKALQAALMMKQPRMEGPQSNLDVQLYRDAAGQIADATVPVNIRKAALQTIRGLHEKYAGVEPAAERPDPLGMRSGAKADPLGIRK